MFAFDVFVSVVQY